ncbi:hypothetical protein PENARI_c018G05852 [Penicillium arizonense]|uniref:Uncharacterized protein n=1 Tax=Penicillium arizonense TaxID=1835702 RepID=A0A1F5LAE9_PENAI|nr:hypothetical protein PENARI_c018G05852 [Penicillium arizonense]OGE50172.1 hypothetical protein PENARI_c018G05852 [Penicillium arizonense]
MADEYRSVLEVLEDLGVPPSDHEFLRRLYSSEDPFPGPSNAELDPTAGNRGPARLSAANLANTLAEPACVQRPPSTPQEQRDPVHYGDEWVSLISHESNSLISELRGQLESPEDIRRPGFAEPPGSSVYDSDRGEPSNFHSDPPTPGPSGYQQASLPRTPARNNDVEDLISSFPRPPVFNSPKGKQALSAIAPGEQQGIVETSTKANLFTPDTSRRVSTPTIFADSSTVFHTDIIDTGDQSRSVPQRQKKQSAFARLSQTKRHRRTNPRRLRADPSRIHGSFSFDTLVILAPTPSPSPPSTPTRTPLLNVSPPISRTSPVDFIEQDPRSTRHGGYKVSLDHPKPIYPSYGSRDCRASYGLFPQPYHSPRASFNSTIHRVPRVHPYCEATDPRFYRKTPFPSPLAKSSRSLDKHAARHTGAFKRCLSRVCTRISSLCDR